MEVILFLLWQLALWWARCTKECCLLVLVVLVQVPGTRSQASSLVLREIVKVMAALEEEEVALAEILLVVLEEFVPPARMAKVHECLT